MHLRANLFKEEIFGLNQELGVSSVVKSVGHDYGLPRGREVSQVIAVIEHFRLSSVPAGT